jgi:hypothetical protein
MITSGNNSKSDKSSKKTRRMKNTDYSSVNGIQSIISSDASFSTLLDIIGDLGLEVISVTGGNKR